MATLSAVKFSTPDGAKQAIDLLKDLESQGLIHLKDAAYVTWPEGDSKPKTHNSHKATQRGALGGTFWGMLFGLLFFVPIFGAIAGAVGGAIVGALSDWGIDDGFVTSVREKVTPGTSAAFLLTEGAVVDRVASSINAAFPEWELIASNLSDEQEHALRLAFAHED